MGYTFLAGLNSEVPVDMSEGGLFDVTLTFQSVEFLDSIDGNFFFNAITPIGRVSLGVDAPRREDGIKNGFTGNGYARPDFSTDPPTSLVAPTSQTVSQFFPLSNLSGGSIQFWGLFDGVEPTLSTLFASSVRELLSDDLPLFLEGSNFSDVLIGKGQNDTIQGNNGEDFLFGGGGNDSIQGGEGNDSLSGDEGDDTLSGDNGDDELLGGAGNDVVHDDEGNNLLFGGDDDDTLEAGSGSDSLFGGEGDDVLSSWNPDSLTSMNKDTLDGGEGKDTYFVDGFPSNSVGASQSTDFISDWQVGESVFWRGAATPERYSTVFSDGEQHLLLRDESGDIAGGFSWGNGLGTTGNRKITATSTEVNGTAAIEFIVVEEKPSAFEEIQRFAVENRTAICTGISVFNALKAIGELRAKVGSIASKSLARTLDPEDLGDDGFGKFARGWLQDVDPGSAADAIEERTTGILDTYFGLLEEKIQQEIDEIARLFTEQGITEASVDELVEAVSKDFCPQLPDESFFATAGELILSPLPVASAVVSVGKAVINSFFTFATAEIERIQREEFEALDSGIEVIFKDGELMPNDREDGSSDDDVETSNGQETIILGAADVNVIGVSANLDGDTIFNFDFRDSITVSGSLFSREDINVTLGSAILDIDTDGDSVADTTIRLEGDFSQGDFATANIGGDTVVTFVPNEPTDTNIPTTGNDALIGDGGNDTIRALAGDDTVVGARGDDLLFGDQGNDVVRGSGGDDRVRGNAGDDTLNGNGGADNIVGGRGNDVILGNGGSDVLRGNGGSDEINGGGGSDNIRGGGGADTVTGGGGADEIFGNGGADVLTGRGGDDTLSGGGGTDVFQFRASDRADTILDFRQGQDQIQIISGANSFGDLTFDQDGQDVLISFGRGQVRVVTDQADSFDEGDFIF